MIYAVIDTNVFVSFFIGKNPNTATKLVVKKVLDGSITPLFDADIIAEYKDVLKRKKFGLDINEVDTIIHYVETFGVSSQRVHFDDEMSDESDRVFYEIALSIEDSFLVTGNLKHYPQVPKVVTPAQFLDIAFAHEA